MIFTTVCALQPYDGGLRSLLEPPPSRGEWRRGRLWRGFFRHWRGKQSVGENAGQMAGAVYGPLVNF
jgi:hypothetical protein